MDCAAGTADVLNDGGVTVGSGRFPVSVPMTAVFVGMDPGIARTGRAV